MQGELDPTWPIEPARRHENASARRRQSSVRSEEWQPSFPGWYAPRPDALFLALRPDDAAGQHIVEFAQALHQRYGLRGGLIGKSRLHVSLLGWSGFCALPVGLVERVEEVLQSISRPPFLLGCDKVVSFHVPDRKRPLVLLPNEGVAEFDALYRFIWERLLAGRLVLEKFRPITPHVTMLYDFREITEQTIPPIRWMVREVTLIHSLRGRKGLGPIHRDLARWTLTG